MHISHRLAALAVTAAAAAAVTATLLATPASAATSQVIAPVSSPSLSTASTAAYWTASARASALPVTPAAVGRVSTALTDEATATDWSLPASGSVDPTAPTVSAATGLSPMATVNQSATVGILYFNDAAGVRRYCTAATINTASQDVVETAGSCVFGTGGNNWHSNFLFVPESRNGSAPLGSFTGLTATTSTGWTGDRQTRYDYAFVRLNPRSDGYKVGQVTGTNGYYYGGTQVRSTIFMGYETDNTQHYCSGTSYAITTNALDGLNCTMSTSAMGGPWLADFDYSTSRGKVFSVDAGVVGGATQGPYQDQFWYTVLGSF